MDIKLVKVEVKDKEILRNLLEKYDYEFSQWDNRDVNGLGLYGYIYLDCYWTEEKRWAFFIKVDDKLAGFVMVRSIQEAEEETVFSMSEFFVMYKYRRSGVGKYAAMKTFDMFQGKWQLKRHPKNTASVYFWNKIISDYTKGEYRLVEGYPNSEYDDGTLADIFFFTTN